MNASGTPGERHWNINQIFTICWAAAKLGSRSVLGARRSAGSKSRPVTWKC